MIQWLRHPKHAVLALVLLGVGLRLPSIWVGFGMDDFAQLAMLGHVYPVERAPADLFTFSDGSRAEVQRLMDRGSLAWWSHPELRLSALRPTCSNEPSNSTAEAMMKSRWAFCGMRTIPTCRRSPCHCGGCSWNVTQSCGALTKVTSLKTLIKRTKRLCLTCSGWLPTQLRRPWTPPLR